MHLIVRLCIGILEVVGGILGVAMIASDAWASRSIDVLAMLIGGLYVVMILAGFALLRGHRIGGILSLILQLAQLPRVAAAGCAYQFAAGAGAWLMFGGNGINVSYALGSDFTLSTTAAAATMPFGVNIVAALAIALLLTVPVPKNERQKKDKRRPLAFA